MSDYHEICAGPDRETGDALTRVRMKGQPFFKAVSAIARFLKTPGDWQRFRHFRSCYPSVPCTVAARAKAYGRHEELEEFPDDSLDSMFRSLEPVTSVNNEIKRCILSRMRSVTTRAPACIRSAAPCNGINDRIPRSSTAS